MSNDAPAITCQPTPFPPLRGGTCGDTAAGLPVERVAIPDALNPDHPDHHVRKATLSLQAAAILRRRGWTPSRRQVQDAIRFSKLLLDPGDVGA